MTGATREAIDAAHEDLGTEDGEVPGIPGQLDFSGREVPAPETAETYPEEIRVDGTTQLAAFDMGGKRATTSSIRLTGGRAQIEDGKAYSKGEVVRFTGTAVIREVGQRDKPDPQTGIVVSCEQKHLAEIVDLRISHE